MKILLIILTLGTSASAYGQWTTYNNEDRDTLSCVLKYPKQAVKNQIQGTVEIRVRLDSNCKIKEYQIVKSLGYGCDESAVTCLRNIEKRIEKKMNRKCEDGLEITDSFTFKLD